MPIREQSVRYPDLTSKFETGYILSAFILITGAYLDAWSHIHIPELETFFTPSHAVLYLGGLMISLLMGLTMYQNWKAGFPLRRSVPKGYQTAILGFIILMLSGIGDMFWHILFGVEQDLEAAFSITHLGVISGIVLLMLAPTRVQRDEDTRNLIPLFAFTLALLGLNVISSWSHPLVKLYPTLKYYEPDIGYSLGILAILLQTVFLMGILLPIFRVAQLPIGSFTFILGIDATYLVFLNANYVFVLTYIVAGLIADFMYWKRIEGDRMLWFRIFSVLFPAILFGLYLVTLFFTNQIVWTPHIVSGAIAFPAILSGFIGAAIIRDDFDFN